MRLLAFKKSSKLGGQTMSKNNELEENNIYQISVPLIDNEDLKKIDNNFNSIIDKFTKQFVEQKDLAIAQYIISKQQKQIEQLENKIKKQKKLQENNISKDKIREKIDKIKKNISNKEKRIKQLQLLEKNSMISNSEWEESNQIFSEVEQLRGALQILEEVLNNN